MASSIRSLPKEFKCPIVDAPMVPAYTVEPCSHNFGSAIFTKIVYSGSACPTCKTRISRVVENKELGARVEEAVRSAFPNEMEELTPFIDSISKQFQEKALGIIASAEAQRASSPRARLSPERLLPIDITSGSAIGSGAEAGELGGVLSEVWDSIRSCFSGWHSTSVR